VVERLKISILYTSGQQVKNVNIIHKWIKISKLCTSGQKVKNVNIMHKWLKGYKCQHYKQVVYTSG
jgi:hypothetical protein